MPLELEVNDPNHTLEITRTDKGSTHQITAKLLKPIFTFAVKENDPWINEKDKTWFVVSSEKVFSPVFKPFVDHYEKVISKPLPESYQKIADKAQAEGKTDIEKFNIVTSELAKEVRYMGDWRSIDGGYVPRPLQTVADTKFGDCKDFASGTTAILRKLGYNAHVALVERGLRPTPLPTLPSLAFNHAILRVETKDRNYWLDPTNFQSFAQGIFEDISERKSLVLYPEGVRLDEIASEGPLGSIQHLTRKIQFYKNGELAIDSAEDLKGLRYILITGIAPEPEVIDYKIEPFDLSSRIVKDYELKAHVRAKNNPLKTTSGPAYKVDSPSNLSNLYTMDPRTRVSDLNLGYPMRKILTVWLDNIEVVGHDLPSCTINSPWIDAKRRISRKGRRVMVQDEYDTKTRLISINDLKGEEFKKTQTKLKDCFQNTAIVYKPSS
jgi:hypothetical protein